VADSTSVVAKKPGASLNLAMNVNLVVSLDIRMPLASYRISRIPRTILARRIDMTSTASTAWALQTVLPGAEKRHHTAGSIGTALRVNRRLRACKGIIGLNDNKERGLSAAEIDPDVQLMLRVREDDAVAFEALITSYQPRLLRVLNPMIGSSSAAEDLVQEVFLRVWRARKNYQASAKFSTWVFHIAHNVASNAIRDRNRKKERQVSGTTQQGSDVISLDQMALASTGMMPARKLDNAERAEMVRMAVEALSERQRTALLLCKFEGLSYQEIADTMDLTVQAVKSLLSRARVNLKTLLEPYLDEGLSLGPEANASDN
jgi:RNA polymerase sigma-70 factor, ECF subfamily